MLVYTLKVVCRFVSGYDLLAYLVEEKREYRKLDRIKIFAVAKDDRYDKHFDIG